METSSLTSSLMPDSQDQQPPSPVLSLVNYLREISDPLSTILLPKPLLQAAKRFLKHRSQPRISATEITALVDALDDGTRNLCCRFDDIAFQTIYALLRISEPCLAYQRGHCLFAESLHETRATTQAQKAAQVVKKAALGASVLLRLINAFVDRSRTRRARRWIGALTLELLRNCHANKNLLSADPGHASRDLGEAILHGDDEILRLIAGTIIREMIDDGSSATDFFQTDDPPNVAINFPNMAEQESQWTTDFIGFIDSLETQGILSQRPVLRGPSTFASAVVVNGTTYNTECGLSILVTLTDELTIAVPPTKSDTAKYIDIPFRNITTIEVEISGPGSQSNSQQPTEAAVLVLHLSEAADPAYYVNESGLSSCRINLAFDTISDATLTKDQIGAMTAFLDVSTQTIQKSEEVATNTLGPTNRATRLSQVAILDASSQPRDQTSTFSAPKPLGAQALQPKNLVDTASQAQDLLTRSASKSSNFAAVQGDSCGRLAKVSDDSVASRAVMEATEYLNVCQRVAPDRTPSQGRRSPGDLSETRLRSPSNWRDGLNIIENATEFQPASKDPQSAIDGVHTMTNPTPAAMSDDDEALYSATPRAPKQQPVMEAASKIQPVTADVATQGDTDKMGAKADRRKLSRSMQAGEGEQSTAFPPIQKAAILQGRGSGAKPSSSTVAHTKDAKRKSTEKPATGPNKKRKFQAVQRSKLNSDVTDTPKALDEFDMVASPPGDRKATPESKKRGSIKAKAPKVAGANTTVRRATVANKPKRLPKANQTGHENSAPDKQGHIHNQAVSRNLADDTRGDDVPSQPTEKQPRQVTARAAKPKVAQTRQPLKVKEHQTTGSGASGPIRSVRSKRAAAQKANQLIQESLNTADQDKIVVDAQSSLSDKESVEETGAERPHKQPSASSYRTTRNVPTLKEKGALSTDELMGHQLPVAAPSKAPAIPNDLQLEGLKIPFRAGSPQSASGPPEGPIQHRASDQAVLPGVLGSSYQQIGALEENPAPYVVEKEEGYGETGRPAANAGALHEMDNSSIEEAMATLDEGEMNTHESLHRADGDDDIVDIQRRPNTSMPVPPGSNAEPVTKNIFVDPEVPTIDCKGRSGPFQPKREVVMTYSDRNEGETAAGHRSSAVALAQNARKSPTRPYAGGASATAHTSGDEVLKSSEDASVHKQRSDQSSKGNATTKRIDPVHLSSQLCNLLDMPNPAPLPVPAAIRARQTLHPKALANHGKSSHKVPSRPSHSPTKDMQEQEAELSRAQVIAEKDKLMSRVQEHTDVLPLDKTKPKLDFDQKGLVIANSDPYTITSGIGSELEMVDDQDDAIPMNDPESSGQVHIDQNELSTINENRVPAAPHRLSTRSQPILDTSTGKKRYLDTKDEPTSKKLKLRTQADISSVTGSVKKETGVHGNLSMRPHLISFGPTGPRNQGILSPERDTVPLLGTDGDRGRQPSRHHLQIRERDHIDHPQYPVQQESIKARIEDSDDPKVVAASSVTPQAGNAAMIVKLRPQVENRPPLVTRQPRIQAKGPLPAHSSLFEEDLAFNIPSQGSRVDENGSPLPSQRSRSLNRPTDAQKDTEEDDSNSENVMPLLNDNEATLVDAELGFVPEPDLPQFTGLKTTRKKEVTFIPSSNIKHQPSSPNAPSAMLTDIQAHAVQAGGRLVNVRTNAVLVPATPHDPFITQKARGPNSFLEQLRRQRRSLEKGQQAVPTAEMVDKRIGRPTPEISDPDATLVQVEEARDPTRGRRRPAPVSSSTSSPDTSEEQSQSSQDSVEAEAARKRWRDALEPSQKDMLGLLYEISHQLVGHMIDKETAVNDVVDDYQRRGSRFNKNLADDLQRELDQYKATVKERRDEEVEKLQELNALVTKNLKRRPVAAELAGQMKEKRQVLDAKMEEAMGFCRN